MSIAIGYMPGAFGQGAGDPGALKSLVEAGDRWGYDSIWLSDRIVSDRFSLEPMVALSMVAAYSPRLKFGTSVLALPLRNPVVLAKQIATLDFLSGGRFFPAVGLGQEEPEEYEACGVSKEDRGARTDEAVLLMRRLWLEERVTHRGRFFSCTNVSITPRPVQKPCTPVWIGGRSPAAARRVGRVGDGWLVSSATPEEVRTGRDIVFSTAAELGREIEEDHVGVLLGCYLAASREQAVVQAGPFVTRARPDAAIAQFSALGTAGDVAGTIQAYIDAGASKFVLRPLCPGRETAEQLERLGREVLPLFHRGAALPAKG
jgi:probable F420-dependent oxidoreductase